MRNYTKLWSPNTKISFKKLDAIQKHKPNIDNNERKQVNNMSINCAFAG